ncbi:zinc finger and BTB domain-containing protein 8A-like [Pristis pectinata]|uniref:zinc finger and BTB domain-containing protein 8A-like n=1 Tax=Pristis pectinata TaxID=685728 RepID=UPI00223DA73C|nr:zinc finger and BTB domain-containing protein 8A-like [Pristis pectinata]XP_051892387.1 zinc finger and BTB domain-containing protein 8A-like [Pristis pectinata]XP_051892388.1 zinc finger and BTB domain-containing protein 8A-like [Pristis pectinata]
MEISSHQARLFQQLNEQRKQEMFCDCSIIVEGRVFKGHRNVLFASSGYFRMLLLHNAQDLGQPTVATFDVFSADAFTIILDFIYSGRLLLTSQNVIDVMSAASYLQMIDVISVCKNFIKSSLDISEKERYLRHSSNGEMKCEEAAPLFTSSRGLESNSCYAQNSDLGGTVGHSWRNFNFHQAVSNLPCSRDQLPISFVNNQARQEVSELAVYKANSLCGSGANARTPEHTNTVPQGDEKRRSDCEPIGLPVSYHFRHQADVLSLPQRNSDSVQQPSRGRGRKAEDWYPPMPTIVEVVGDWNGESAGDCNILPKMRFKCPFCTHTVKRKSDLKRHLRSHTGERPYPCDSCGKRFTRLEHLRSHLLTIHKSRKVIICKVCRKPFTGIAAKIVQHDGRSFGLCNNCVNLMNSGHDDEPIDLDAHPDNDREFQENDKESGWISTEPDGDTEILSSGGEDPGSNEVHAVEEILDDADEKNRNHCH